jgi:hypothetical protein
VPTIWKWCTVKHYPLLPRALFSCKYHSLIMVPVNLTPLKLPASIYYTHITFFFSIVPAETMDWGTWYIQSCMNCNTKFIHGNFTQIFFINVHYFNSSVTIVSGIQAGWPRNQCWLPQGTDTNFFLHRSWGLLSLLSTQHWRRNP